MLCATLAIDWLSNPAQALEFGARRLWDVQFHSILSLSSGRPTPIDVRLHGSQWSVHSASAGDFTSTWPPTVSTFRSQYVEDDDDSQQYNRMHATGYLSMDSELDTEHSIVPLHDLRMRLRKMDMEVFYDKLALFANYGATYRRVLSCYHGVDASGLEEFLVGIQGAGDDLDKYVIFVQSALFHLMLRSSLSEYRLHPAVLDAALQVAVHPLITGAITPGRYYLPSKIGAFIVHDALAQGIPERIYAHGVFVKWMPGESSCQFEAHPDVLKYLQSRLHTISSSSMNTVRCCALSKPLRWLPTGVCR